MHFHDSLFRHDKNGDFRFTWSGIVLLWTLAAVVGGGGLISEYFVQQDNVRDMEFITALSQQREDTEMPFRNRIDRLFAQKELSSFSRPELEQILNKNQYFSPLATETPNIVEWVDPLSNMSLIMEFDSNGHLKAYNIPASSSKATSFNLLRQSQKARGISNRIVTICSPESWACGWAALFVMTAFAIARAWRSRLVFSQVSVVYAISFFVFCNWFNAMQSSGPHNLTITAFALLAVLLSLISLLFAHLLWSNARTDICHNCGYDLRATPGRCPECGLISRD